MAVVGRHGGKVRNGKGNTARRHPGHHRQEPFQDGIDPDNRCHTDARNEEETPDAPRALGSSFDEIDDAVRTAKNPEATATERERAAKVFTDMEGTELYEKLMNGSSEMSIRIKGLIEIRLKKPKKDFVVPDSIEDFDIRNYV